MTGAISLFYISTCPLRQNRICSAWYLYGISKIDIVQSRKLKPENEIQGVYHLNLKADIFT